MVLQGDNISLNLPPVKKVDSSFLAFMQNIGSNSLIIMDELGRGTSNEEGSGICHAVCEYLIRQKVCTSCLHTISTVCSFCIVIHILCHTFPGLAEPRGTISICSEVHYRGKIVALLLF